MREQVKQKVIAFWLQGKTRDEISTEVQISAGSVTNIIKSWSTALDDADYSAVRDLAVQSRKMGMSVKDCAEAFRFKKFVEKLMGGEKGTKEDSCSSSFSSSSCSSYEKLEMVISNIKNICIDSGLPHGKLAYTLLQVFELSNEQRIHPLQVPYYIITKIQEKKQLEQNIEKLGEQKQQCEKETNEALQKRNLTIDSINRHNRLEEELAKLAIPPTDIQRMINAINNTNQLGYEPARIAKKFGKISSLEKKEAYLENKCSLLEQKADGYGEIFSLCKQLFQLKILPTQLKSLVRTILEIAKRDSRTNDDNNNDLSTTTIITSEAQQAATSRFLDIIEKYRTIEELDTIDRASRIHIKTLRKRLESLHKFSAHKNHAISALISLYCKGVKEDHILYIHNFFSRYSNKINLETLETDLEKYEDIKEVIHGLSKERILRTNQNDHLRMEMSSLKEKIGVMQLRITKMRKVMKHLSKKVAKAALAFNLPSAILSTETLIAILSSIDVDQKLEEKKKKKELENTRSTNKITRYNSHGEVVI